MAGIIVVALGLSGCAGARSGLQGLDPEPAPTGSVWGVVVDERDGRRVDGALVLLQGSHDDETIELELEIETDERGRYAFGGVPPGRYTVWLWAGHAERTARVELGATSIRTDFVLDPDELRVCYFPWIDPQESLMSLSKHEARLLGVPRTKIFR